MASLLTPRTVRIGAGGDDAGRKLVTYKGKLGLAQPRHNFTTVRTMEKNEQKKPKTIYCPYIRGLDYVHVELESDHTRISRRFAYVSLSKTGGGPDIPVEPAVLNFEDVALLAPARRAISRANLGYEKLEVRDIQINSPYQSYKQQLL